MKKTDGITAIFHPTIMMNKKDLLGMKYFLAFCAIVMSVYIYSMATGWRFVSYGESGKSTTTNRTTNQYHHK